MNVYNYNHLFYFYVVAKLEGVTAAAEHLNTSQPSLSTQIKTLEATLGRSLFRKNGRQIELTDGGKELFNYCRRAFEIFDEMFDQIKADPSSMGVRVSVGVSTDIDRPFITEALSKTSKLYPLKRRPLLNLTSLPCKQLLPLLRAGEIDFMLASESLIDHDMEVISEFDFQVGIYASKSFLAEQGGQSLEDLLKKNNLAFVLPSKMTSLRSEIDEYFVRRKFRPACVFESNIMASVIRAATDGMGATLMPRAYVSREVQLEKLVAIEAKPLWRHKLILVSIKHRVDEHRNNFADNFAQGLSISLKDLGNEKITEKIAEKII